MSRTTCVILALCALQLAGCVTQAIIRKPAAGTEPNPSHVTSPVLIELDWSGIKDASGTPYVGLDSVDITSAFGPMSGKHATASVPTPPGTHQLTAIISLNSSINPQYQEILTFIVDGPTFSLALNPSTLNVPPGATGSTIVTLQPKLGFNGTVQLSLTPTLPPSLTATIPPASTGPQWTITVAATASAPTTTVAGSVTGTAACSPGCSGTLTASAPLTISVPPPSVSAASPNPQIRGGSVTVTGSNFSPVCSNNSVTIDGASALMTTSCSNTSLTFTVPPSTTVGAKQLFVTTNATKSNSIAFTVARQAGNFVEISNDIVGQNSTGRLCPTGAVRLDICTPPNPTSNCSGHPAGASVATFNNTATGVVIGSPVEFRKNSSQVSGLGGAGFSLCNVGIVLDGDAIVSGSSAQLMALKFFDLPSGSPFQANLYGFNWSTPKGVGYAPRIFRSPDGTILLVVTAATIGPDELTAGFIDQSTGRLMTQIGIAQSSGAIAATVTTNNKISFTFGGTTYPLINIP